MINRNLSQNYEIKNNQPRDKRQQNKRLGKLKIQKAKWLNQIDEIRKQNESKEEIKEEIKELKLQYNLTEDNQYEILNKELIPLHLIDYEIQCKIKQRRLDLFLKQFVDKIKEYSSTIILDSDGYPCVFNDLIRSDVIDEYQSQNEFQINIDISKSIAVGQMLGTFKTGQTCIRPIKFAICKRTHRALAGKFEQYLKEISTLKVILDYKSQIGNWTNFFVRSNEVGEHQCLAILNNQNLTSDQLNKEQNLLKNYFQSISNEFKIKSFSLEITSSRKKNDEDNLIASNSSNQLIKPKIELLFGDKYLSFRLNDHLYKISTKSLFPMNLNVYHKMFDYLIENLELSKNQNLVFVSPYSVLNLPSLEKLVDTLFVLNKVDSSDCKKSLEHFKSIKNIEFRSGNLIKNLFKILDNNFKEICILIRQEDLSIQILNELRNNKNVSKIVLISTKPQENLLKIWIQLCLDNKNNAITGNPFNFISAVPIDTHPHSNIYTIVSVFERIVF